MNFWKKIERLGITDDMPIYKQKSTMFFNIVMRISIFFMLLIPLLMYLIKDLVYIPIGILAGIPVIGFSLFLNYKGKVNLSVFIISLFFPIYFIALSLFSKYNGEGSEYFAYVLPRFGIIVMTVLSFAVIGFDRLGKAFVGTIVGAAAVFLFDPIHDFFGLGMDNIVFQKPDSQVVVIVVGGLLIFFIMITFFMQRINSQYERIVLKQKESIEVKNEELNQQNEEITSQRDEIETQRDTVTEQKERIEGIHHELSQSIDYATRLQKSILPDKTILAEYLSDHFVLFKPKDKVSGDFYWWTHVERHTIITAADCTGHGVPGAFMSMLGVSLLREIVNKEYVTHSGVILRKLRKEVIRALKQKGEPGEQKDGMDMALVSINSETKLMQFSGANNPLYIVREGELNEYKGDKMPIAIYDKMDKYTTHEIQLETNDQLYMFSDGYADQFGGSKPGGKKFMYKPFKKLITANSDKSMKEQLKVLDSTLQAWKGNIEQIDDITVIGLKI